MCFGLERLFFWKTSSVSHISLWWTSCIYKAGGDMCSASYRGDVHHGCTTRFLLLGGWLQQGQSGSGKPHARHEVGIEDLSNLFCLKILKRKGFEWSWLDVDQKPLKPNDRKRPKPVFKDTNLEIRNLEHLKPPKQKPSVNKSAICVLCSFSDICAAIVHQDVQVLPR